MPQAPNVHLSLDSSASSNESSPTAATIESLTLRGKGPEPKQDGYTHAKHFWDIRNGLSWGGEPSTDPDDIICAIIYGGAPRRRAPGGREHPGASASGPRSRRVDLLHHCVRVRDDGLGVRLQVTAMHSLA